MTRSDFRKLTQIAVVGTSLMLLPLASAQTANKHGSKANTPTQTDQTPPANDQTNAPDQNTPQGGATQNAQSSADQTANPPADNTVNNPNQTGTTTARNAGGGGWGLWGLVGLLGLFGMGGGRRERTIVREDRDVRRIA